MSCLKFWCFRLGVGRSRFGVALLAFSSLAVISIPAQTITQSNDTLPRVVEHAQPIYPPLARTARIEGDVRIKITTNADSVKDAEVESGHPLLRQAAVDNVKTWKFATHEPGIFHVTFRYKLLLDNVEVIFPESTVVHIMAPPPELFITHADLGLGTWLAHLSSSYGEFQCVLDLAYSGPDDREWVEGKMKTFGGQWEDIDSAFYKDGLFGFTVNLREPNGHHVRTFFVGKIIGKRISGTFVDDTGVTGQWSATRVHQKSKSPAPEL
jgi:TonB family protein